jgi:hypothetical protein
MRELCVVKCTNARENLMQAVHAEAMQFWLSIDSLLMSGAGAMQF